MMFLGANAAPAVLTGLYRGVRLDHVGTTIDNFSTGTLGNAADFADNFNRANSTNLGANWNEGQLETGIGNLSIASNQLTQDVTGANKDAMHVSPAATTDQWVEFFVGVISSNASGGVYGVLRAQNPAATTTGVVLGGYRKQVSGWFLVGLHPPAGGTHVSAVTSASAVPGNVTVRLEAEGNQYRLFVGGVLTCVLDDA